MIKVKPTTVQIIFLILICFLILPGAVAQNKPRKKPTGLEQRKKNEKSDDEKLAAEFIKSKDYEKAVVLYEKLYNEKETQYYYTYYLFCLTELQDYKTALKTIRKQKRKNPARLRYLVDEGYIYSLSGDQSKAKKMYDEALKSLSADRNQIRDLANAFNYRGQTDYAIKTYKEGRKLLSDYPFNLELARIYDRLGNSQDMINEYLNLLEFDISKMELVQARLQTSINKDPENEKSDVLRKELLRRVQKNPEKTFYSEMLIWFSVQQKDFDMAFLQAKSLDRRLNEDGFRVYDLGYVCVSNESYDVAIDAFSYLLSKGAANTYYLDARIGLLNARYLKVTNRFDYTHQDLLDLENEYLITLEEFGENSSTVPIMRYMAHLQAFYLDNIDEAKALLDKAVSIPNVPFSLKAECKIELADILLFSGDVWEATLLYSQVDKDFKNDALGHLAKLKNAKLSYYIGEFGWAKAQLDVLKAATSKLIANDAMDMALLISDNIDMDSSYTALSYYSKADLLVYRNKFEQALLTLDSVQMVSLWHPLFDEVLYKKAEIKLKQGKFSQADSLLSKVVEMYPEDILADNALMKRAELYENQFKDISKAMELYEKILTDYPGSLFVVEARKRFRNLRGDMIN